MKGTHILRLKVLGSGNRSFKIPVTKRYKQSVLDKEQLQTTLCRIIVGYLLPTIYKAKHEKYNIVLGLELLFAKNNCKKKAVPVHPMRYFTIDCAAEYLWTSVCTSTCPIEIDEIFDCMLQGEKLRMEEDGKREGTKTKHQQFQDFLSSFNQFVAEANEERRTTTTTTTDDSEDELLLSEMSKSAKNDTIDITI